MSFAASRLFGLVGIGFVAAERMGLASPVPFALFERYDLEGPDRAQPVTYAQLAQEFGLPVTQVTNHLAAMRRLFRQLILDRLRASTAERPVERCWAGVRLCRRG